MEDDIIQVEVPGVDLVLTTIGGSETLGTGLTAVEALNMALASGYTADINDSITFAETTLRVVVDAEVIRNCI